MLTTHLTDAITACEHALTTGVGLNTACQMLGNVLQGMGLFQESIVWHTRAIEPELDQAATYASLGGLYAKQERWQLAIDTYQRVLQLDPGYAEAYRSLASIYAQLGQREIELEHRYQAVLLHPQWATPSNQLELGNALREINKLDEALDCYNRAIQLQPNLYEAHYNKGVMLVEQGQPQNAQASFERVLELHPEHGPSHYALGKLAAARNDVAAALKHYRQSTLQDPTFVNAYYMLGEILLKERQWADAAIAYQQALKLDEPFSWSHHNLGYALLKQGQYAEATAVLSRAIALNADSPWTYHHLGDAWVHLAHWENAVAAFLAAAQLQEDLEGLYPRLGYALRRRSAAGLEETIRHYQQAMPLSPDNQTPEFYAHLARQLWQHQQCHAAVILYRLALTLQPQDPLLQLQLEQELEQARLGQEHIDQTIAAFRSKMEQHPDQAWLYTQFGNLLASQGEVEEAIALHRTGSILQGWQCAAYRRYQFTHDWFTHNIAVWMLYLKPFMHYPSVQILEIGSFEGMSTCWFLDHILTHPLAQITCIDLYFQEKFDSNIAQTEAADRVIKLSGDSHAQLATLNNETYDIIYIDGCHLALHVQKDAMLAWRLLKPGGVLIFDDYGWDDPNYPGQETRLGVDAFLDTVSGMLEILHSGSQLIVRKLIS